VIGNASTGLVGGQKVIALHRCIFCLGHKRLLKQFLCGVPTRRVYHEHLAYERSRIFGNVVGINEFALRNLFIKFLIVLASKWELPAKHRKHKDTRCPDIGRRSNILFFHYDFRTHVWRRAAENFKLNIVWGAAAKAEVNQLYHSSLVNYDVFQLDISVSHVTLM